jgi:DNA repair protein RadC
MFHQRAESLRLNGPGPSKRFFTAAHLDDQTRCIHLARYEGSDGAAPMPLREVLTDACIHGSNGMIVAHNHPSGDPTPSASDCALTRRLALVGEAMDFAVLDHLVLVGSECASMRSMGLF